jgi:hypothetical protein
MDLGVAALAGGFLLAMACALPIFKVRASLCWDRAAGLRWMGRRP